MDDKLRKRIKDAKKPSDLVSMEDVDDTLSKIPLGAGTSKAAKMGVDYIKNLPRKMQAQKFLDTVKKPVKEASEQSESKAFQAIKNMSKEKQESFGPAIKRIIDKVLDRRKK